MGHVGLAWNASFDNNIFDLTHDLIHITSLGVNYFENSKHGSFVALFFFLAVVVTILITVVSVVVFLFSLLIILLELIVRFVDRIVG